MTKKILTLTLLATTLAFSSVIPRETLRTSKQRINSIVVQIAHVLSKRGIDDDKALQIAQEFTGKDQELFSIMMHNYINNTDSNKEALFTELGRLALFKKKADFSSYAFLIKLTQSLNKTQLNKENLQKLEAISTNNSLLSKIFT